MALSGYLAGALLELSVGVRPGLVSDPLYLALLTAAPQPDGPLVEPAFLGYARVAVPAAAFGAAANRTITNVAEIPLPVPLAGDGALIVAWALCEADGQVLHTGDSAPFVLTPEDPAPRIAPGILQISFP
jgi:hypothetical protein